MIILLCEKGSVILYVLKTQHTWIKIALINLVTVIRYNYIIVHN